MKVIGIAAIVGAHLLVCQSPVIAQEPPLEQILSVAANSKCASVNWKDRGFAKKAYYRGMALVFARALCQLDRKDVRVVSAAKGVPGTSFDRSDALTWYDREFVKLGMSNDKDGVDTLRHAYVLLIGLGMRESSGEYCTGRDMSADFSSSESAEAGLFQTSWGARKSHPVLAELYEGYSADGAGCLLETFQKDVKCKKSDAKNWGQGTGVNWQELTKACPAFATEYAAVLIRTNGGSKGEFGPLRRKQVEIRPECDRMLSEVQTIVQANPQLCDSL